MKRVDKGSKWTWSALRPGAIIGFSLVRHSGQAPDSDQACCKQ